MRLPGTYRIDTKELLINPHRHFIGRGIVIILTAIIKDQIARIRLPHLKYVLSALLFSLGTLWAIEAAGIDITDLVLIPFFLAYLGINYLIIKL